MAGLAPPSSPASELAAWTRQRTAPVAPSRPSARLSRVTAKFEARQVFGKPDDPVRCSREGFLDGFFVNFDSAGRIEIIELAKSPLFRATFHGECLHELPAKEAVTFVSQYGHFDDTDKELGYSYVFLDLQLSLWRGTRPEPNQALDDPDGRHFEAVGIAIPGYFKQGGV